MEFQYWQLVFPIALGAVVVWGLRNAREATLLGLAGTLLATSGLLLYTLILDEPYLDPDVNSQVEDLALIGMPAALGVAFGVVGVKRLLGRRA